MMRLGRSGFEVSRLCLGTMMFGAWGATDVAACRRIVDAALDGGITFVDCADIYDFGVAEEILGHVLGARRDRVVLATKFGNPMSADPAERGASRRWIIAAVEASLRRLDTDWIDLYQLHRPDPDTPLEETLAALDALVAQGKVRAVGTSTFPAELLVDAAWTADRTGCTPFATEQPPYSIFARGIEAHVLPTCERLDLGVLVWAPLNGGWLTGKYRPDTKIPADARGVREAEHFDLGTAAGEHKSSLIAPLERIAADAGCSLPQLAIAFTLAHPAVTSAIVGPRSVDQLQDLLGADTIVLDDETLDRIDALVEPGTNINPTDAGYVPPPLANAAARRRSDRALGHF